MRGVRVLLTAVLSSVAAATAATAAPTLTATQTYPAVVPAAGPAAALVVLKTSEPTTGIRFVYETAGAGEPVTFQRIGADVFAGLLHGPRVLAGYDKLASVDRTIPGHFEIAGSTGGQPFLTLAVDDGSFPDVPIKTLAPDVRCAPHVLNIDLGGDPWAGEDNETPIRRAYEFLPDAFDTANVVLANPSQRENRHHIGLRNNVSGIGKPIQQSPGRYGSESRLFGLVHYPIPELFDLASPGANHELGHQWINFLGKPGQPDAWLASSGSHWPPSDMARGPMGFNVASNPQGLDFPYELTDVGAGPSGQRQYRIDASEQSKRFHPLDLYLMGLLPPAEVPPFAVVSPAESSRFGSGVPAGETVLGRQMTISDVVSAQGTRSPAAAPRTFSNLSIVVTRNGLLSDRELAFYDEQAARGEATAPLMGHSGRVGPESFEPFHMATSGRGSLTTALNCPGTPEPRATLPGLFRGLVAAIQASAFDPAGKPALIEKAVAAGQAFAASDTHGMNARLAELSAALGDSAAGTALRPLVTEVGPALAPSTPPAALRIGALKVRRGARVRFVLNRGTRVRLVIMRRGEVVRRFVVAGRAGETSAKLPRGLRPGRYTLRARAGASTASVTFRIVRRR